MFVSGWVYIYLWFFLFPFSFFFLPLFFFWCAINVNFHVHIYMYVVCCHNDLSCTCTCTWTNESDTTLSYLDVSISICQGKFITEVFDKRDNFNFNIVNYPYMCSNIPTKPTYGVYISQLIRISRICDKLSCLQNVLSCTIHMYITCMQAYCCDNIYALKSQLCSPGNG